MLKASLDAIAFSQDMPLNVPFIAEWQTITCNQQELKNNGLLKFNK